MISDDQSLLRRLDLYPVDDYPKMPRPYGEVPPNGLEVPPSLFLLNDQDLFEFMQKVSALEAFAEDMEGQYARRLEETNSDLRHAEARVWRELFPDGKPRSITVEDAKMLLLDHEEVREARLLRDFVKQHFEAAHGMTRAYTRYALLATQVIKYRTYTGDRMPNEKEASLEGVETGDPGFKF